MVSEKLKYGYRSKSGHFLQEEYKKVTISSELSTLFCCLLVNPLMGYIDNREDHLIQKFHVKLLDECICKSACTVVHLRCVNRRNRFLLCLIKEYQNLEKKKMIFNSFSTAAFVCIRFSTQYLWQ